MLTLILAHAATYGFSLGINDVIPGPILAEKKNEMVERAYADCQQLIQKAKFGKLENKPGCDQEQTLEAMISGVLSKVRGDVGDICMKELSRHNAPLIMATSGSKGLSSSIESDIVDVHLTPLMVNARLHYQRLADGGLCGSADHQRTSSS